MTGYHTHLCLLAQLDGLAQLTDLLLLTQQLVLKGGLLPLPSNSKLLQGPAPLLLVV